MVDEGTVSPKLENAEKVPEANDVKYQNSFAQPLSTERKEEDKVDQNNYQTDFGKSPADDNQQQGETKSQPEHTNSWNEIPDQKTSKENQDEKQETIIPIKIETQNPSSATPQNETPKVESNKWEAPKIDDQVESSLFSAPSPLNDDDFWIEVPASGVIHQIPISIQKSDTPINATSQQPSSTPTPTPQNQQTSIPNDKASKDETISFQEKTSEPSLPSVGQPTKDNESIYHEVSVGDERQQQNPSSANDSFNNQTNQLNNDAKSSDTSNTNEAQNSVQQLDSVRSPTKKYDDDSIELNIQEYEERLRKNTQEALNLVDKLCESSSHQQQHERQAKRDREYERRSSQSPTNRDRSRSHSVQFNESQLDAQSYRVNPDLMKDPTAAILLPDFRLALADNEFGLSIFNLHTKDLKRIDGGNKWRRPLNMIYLPRAKQFLVLCEYSEKEDGKYQLFVCRFNSELEYINRVEAPIFIRDKEILTFRMAYCHRTDCLYLAASTFNTGYIYELAPDGFWREVYTGRNKTFVDISIFAVIGPVTELMLVDTSKDYIVVVSIYNSEAADTRRVAACEKPSALTIDEKGTVIIYDRCSCKVGIHSRLDNLRVHDIALVNHPKCQLSGWDRLLAVLIPSKKDLRLYKY
uniref:CNH domain-containing protein n=1 Tax=Panagrolaimus superbus TaxID=310955 RepID=A0A914Z6J9_9BILA